MRVILKLLMINLSFLSCICFALNTDKSKPLIINADIAQLNHRDGIGVYLGNVVLKQGSSELFADKLVTHVNKQNQITKAIATGKKARYSTLLKRKQKKLHAEALTIEYFPLIHKIVLIEDAVVRQKKNTFSGPLIEYNISDEHIVSKKSGDGSARTTIIFHPETEGH